MISVIPSWSERHNCYNCLYAWECLHVIFRGLGLARSTTRLMKLVIRRAEEISSSQTLLIASSNAKFYLLRLTKYLSRQTAVFDKTVWSTAADKVPRFVINITYNLPQDLDRSRRVPGKFQNSPVSIGYALYIISLIILYYSLSRVPLCIFIYIRISYLYRFL